MVHKKSVRRLTIKDFQEYPIWEYGDDLPSETQVRPVASLPVDTLENRVVGTQVRLNNGMLKWAVLSLPHLVNLSIMPDEFSFKKD